MIDLENLSGTQEDIIYELMQESSRSNSSIARSIGVKRKKVSYFINKLKEEKIVVDFLTRIQQSLFCTGVALVLWKLKHPRKTKEVLIQELKDDPRVNWLVALQGTYQIASTVQFKSPEDLQMSIDKIMEENNDFILNTKKMIYSHEYFFDKSGLFGEKSVTTANSFSSEDNHIDSVEKKILHGIARNARKSYDELAEQVTVSSSTVRRRIESMKERGIIQGSTISTNLNNLGYSSVIIQFKTTSKIIPKMASYAVKKSNIIHCARMVGDHDITMTVAVKSLKELYKVVDGISENFGHAIESQEQHHIRNECKEVFVDPRLILESQS